MFPTTHCTVMAQAPLHGDTDGKDALEVICREYREPILSYICRHGVETDHAEDVAHDFLVEISTNTMLSQADRSKGGFRSYLCTALTGFLISRNRKSAGPGGSPTLPLDDSMAVSDTSVPVQNEADFDRDWAVALLKGACTDLKASVMAGNKEPSAWPVLSRFLLPGQVPPPDEEAAAKLGTSPAGLRAEISRQRSKFRDCLRQRVLATVSSETEADHEMRHLFTVLNLTTGSTTETFNQERHHD